MSRITSIRENWKVKEQGCGDDMNKWNEPKYLIFCQTCKATLKATYEENLKEAESMLEELNNEIDFLNSFYNYNTFKEETTNFQVANQLFRLKRIRNQEKQKAEWQKLRDEIKLKLELK